MLNLMVRRLDSGPLMFSLLGKGGGERKWIVI